MVEVQVGKDTVVDMYLSRVMIYFSMLFYTESMQLLIRMYMNLF